MEKTSPQEALKQLPHSPGVYVYRDRSDVIIYIGKAKDLKKRVTQYFQRDDAVGPKTKLLVSQIDTIQTIDTASEFDALLLEAKLIHDNSPKYNVVLKDDKSPLYILLTLSETLPHVLTLRRGDLPKKINTKDALFGPFQSAGVARSILRQLRYTIPYCTQKRRTGTACFYTHLGMCNPCPSAIEKMEESDTKKQLIHDYRLNIFRLKDILSGSSNTVLTDLERDMKTAAVENKFEEAALIRNHIQNLRYLLEKRYDPMMYTASDAAVEDIYESELEKLQTILSPYIPGVTKLHRIECIDISNTGGKNATGSLVVLTDGKKDTAEYKKFRIRRENVPNDFAMVAEVLTRRLTHPEWPLPNLLIIDGGKGQVTAALHALSAVIPSVVEGSPWSQVPIIGLAKRFEEIIIPLNMSSRAESKDLSNSIRWKVVRIPLTSPAIHLMQRIRDEAHRFAITYHRLLRSKTFKKS